MNWQDEGKEPDYRFSLANERTFLAWIRTALGVLAGGILLHEFVVGFEPRWIVPVLAVGLALLSALIGTGAYLRWKDIEIAMRHDRPLPRAVLMPVLSAALTVLALVIAIFLVWK